MTLRWGQALAAGAAWMWLPVDQPPQVFRASTHAVSVDVAVFDGERAVPDLGTDHFEVVDNGVSQTLLAADFNHLPIDLRLVFDVSGSISAADLEHALTSMRQVAAALGPRDHCEILTFNAAIAEAAPRRNPPMAIALERAGPDGTALFDAVSLALVTVPDRDRRQITIVLSDGQDTASFFDEATLLDVSRRTDAVVYAVLPGARPPGVTPAIARLHALAMLTGGRVLRAPHPRRLGNTVVAAIEEFRRSYVLRYILSGVPIEGWHDLKVTVRGPRRYDVRARSGYLGR